MKKILSAYFGIQENVGEKLEIKPLLSELKKALSDMDALQIDDVLEKISGNMELSDKTYFDDIRKAVDDCDFDKAENVLSKWTSKL